MKTSPSQVSNGAYGKIANAYDAFLTFSGFKRGVESFLDRLDLRLPPSPVILDAGCGTGLMSRYLARRFPDARIVATDIDANMLREMERLVAEEGNHSAKIIIAEGDLAAPEQIRLFRTGQVAAISENYFDAIFVSGALEHVPLAETSRRLSRLLKPGGLLLNLALRRSPAGAILAMMYDCRPYTLAAMKSACETAGLEDIRVLRLKAEDFPANLSRIAVIARKGI